MAHPDVARRSCSTCSAYYFDDSGRIKRTWQVVDGRRELVPMKRRAGDRPGCWKCPKCEGLPADKRTPENGKNAELSEKNEAAVRFYFEQKACGGPVDAVARRNCGIIEAIVSEAHGKALADLSGALWQTVK